MTEPAWFTEDDCNLRDMAALCDRQTSAAMAPSADRIVSKIPIYDIPALGQRLADMSERRALMAEWAHILRSGPGVLVLSIAYADTAPIDAATAVYEEVIRQEKAAQGGGADHFAASGANDRIWNSLAKLGLAAPEVFVPYFACPAIDAVCEAWLGPGYQMTAQVNVVRPGGAAQQAHRDYHLGFQTAELSARYPAHVHDLSPVLTLQGGIAHVDTPIESGPTKLLPFSQLYRPGYAAWRRDDFRAYFEEHHVQVPLKKGDAVFFNPALFHAAGSNDSADVQRMVNLLQVSSPFGRAMESIDRTGLSLAIFEPLQAAWQAGRLTQAERDAVIAASAEGYSFPTNLDTDPPLGGLAPKTQAAVLREAVVEGWVTERLAEAFAAQNARRLP
ncbi:phytanoyl-CoA dioxygenase [Alphaproteobacteria bacterium GH1-50]|uniref:Phytanoyl-CoA dioxygenase n=1 Tax=Kangsaoukella pontilimi TaxID=2691042 RepID=A0A7C9IQY5_9RHOB|nr:phytanoyl-CoA dioxygenase family protein [Kangsaoukella pontilimi]MXQ06826.1 phytanoyl-CoA dioxygenase [Kangsaoukella pontilimi]